MTGFLDSSATILAERASVVLYGWAREGDEQAARALAFQYPLLNHDLVPNVLAALLLLYGSHTRDELARRLDEWQVSEGKRKPNPEGAPGICGAQGTRRACGQTTNPRQVRVHTELM